MGRVDYFDDPYAPTPNCRVPGVVAVVRDDSGRVLLSRRMDTGWWVVPGGRIELGETIAQAAVREVWEETGVEVEITGFAAIHTSPNHVIAYDDGRILEEFSITLYARAVAGSPRPDGCETSAVRWFTFDGLAALDLHPVMRERIRVALDPDAAPVIA